MNQSQVNKKPLFKWPLSYDISKVNSQPKESNQLKISMQKEFLKDQSRTKKAEQAWFDRLEDELDRMETDEKLLDYKILNSKKMIQQEINRKEVSSHSVAI